MSIVNIHEAKTHFSKLINEALAGKQVIIAKAGVPLVKLTPYNQESNPRQSGQLKGLITISKDFDAPLPKDLLETFYGEDE